MGDLRQSACSGPDRRASTAPLSLAAVALACGLLTACGGEPLPTYLELADFAAFQAGSVSTTRISPEDPLEGLIDHGWMIEPGEGAPPALVMLGDRARLWFFSADGATTGVELHGRLVRSRRERGRRLLCQLNGDKQAVVVVKRRPAVHRIDFAPGSVRVGWNFLMLSLRRLRDPADKSLLSLRGARFLSRERNFAGRRSPGRIEGGGEELRMPAGSLLDAVFEVPPGARFQGRLSAEPADGGSPEVGLGLTLTVTGADGLDTELARLSVPAGGSARIDEPLDRWSGSTVRLRTVIGGSGPRAARWSEARIAAPGATRAVPFDRLIRPAPADRGGALGRPDVVIILLDAARADAFSPWGGPHPTPALERLAAAGTRFERALSPSSWTGQSVPAILTGFYPDTVGISHWGDSLAPEVTTMAELFTGSGYHTALWSQHPVYSRGRSIARGFETTTFAGHDDRGRVPEVDELLVEDRPTLAFVHLLPPHTPYEPPPPFRGTLSSWYTVDPAREWPIRKGFPHKKQAERLSADDRRYIRDRYQENALFADALVGRILDRLTSAGRYDDALIVVLSDHGEAFLEHGEFLHSSRLYWEFLQVPLVIKWPASLTGFRAAVGQPVSLVDLAPTLVSGLALAGAERGFQGRDLLPAVLEDRPLERALYAITRGDGDPTRPPKRRIRIERDGWAGIWSQLDDRLELYDLAADPTEQRDLASAHPAHALRLRQELQMQHHFNRSLLSLAAGDATELDPELVEELRALGYL